MRPQEKECFAKICNAAYVNYSQFLIQIIQRRPKRKLIKKLNREMVCQRALIPHAEVRAPEVVAKIEGNAIAEVWHIFLVVQSRALAEIDEERVLAPDADCAT